MTEIQITNCHTHTFTNHHVPLNRLYQFQQAGSGQSQQEIFEALLPYYPEGTRFVVLPMEMSEIGFGPVMKDITEQHNSLAALADHPDNQGLVVPFATVYPGKPGSVDEMKRCIEDLGFRGLKLYPRLGYAPGRPDLMGQVYRYLEARN